MARRLYELPPLEKCPGCVEMIRSDEICCDPCWKRAPLRLRMKLNIAHKVANWPRYNVAADRIKAWLTTHYDPHAEFKDYP